MSKTGKNLLIGFTVLCALVFVIFCIELIVLNGGRDGDSREGQAASEGASAETEGSGNSPPTIGDGKSSGESEPPESGQPDGDESPGGARPAPIGKAHLLSMPDSMELVLYADEQDFEYTEDLGTEERLAMFTYRDGENSSLEIRFGSVTLLGPDVLAEDIIGDFPGDVRITQTGEGPILRSPLSAVSYFGKDGDLSYEIWIHTVLKSETDSLAVVFIINYKDNTQRNALYAILDSMEMRMSKAAA